MSARSSTPRAVALKRRRKPPTGSRNFPPSTRGVATHRRPRRLPSGRHARIWTATAAKPSRWPARRQPGRTQSEYSGRASTPTLTTPDWVLMINCGCPAITVRRSSPVCRAIPRWRPRLRPLRRCRRLAYPSSQEFRCGETISENPLVCCRGHSCGWLQRLRHGRCRRRDEHQHEPSPSDRDRKSTACETVRGSSSSGNTRLR